jgi:hypothetical protein
MRKVEVGEILDLTAYEKIREHHLVETIEMKKARRVAVGDRLTFIFENRETVLFQIQEMVRVERIVDEKAIRAEVDVYNDLIPDEYELSATLMLEIPQSERIRDELDRLIGIDEHVFLDVGDGSVRALFDEKQFEADRISAVQYIRFPLGPELSALFEDETQAVVLRVAHPHYEAQVALKGEPRRSLIADLRSGS